MGSIAPDCVNLNGQASKDLRWPAHLRCESLEEWTENARRFYNENKGSVDESYLKGYVLHILTDIAWDKYCNIPLYIMLSGDGVDTEKLKEARWNEIYGYEQTQLCESWLKNEVLPKLRLAVPQKIGTLSAVGVGLWQEQIVNLQLKSANLPKFVTDSFMNDFFSRILELCQDIFK